MYKYKVKKHKARNPKKQCQMCGKEVQSNMRFCQDCHWQRKRAKGIAR